MRLLLVISALGPGGAERQLSEMANYWADKGGPVTLLTLSKAAGRPFYSLHPAVRRHDLKLIGPANSLGAEIAGSFGALHALRRQIYGARPDVVVSFIDKTNILALAATRGLGIPVIVSERVNIGYHRVGWRWHTLRRALYPFAARVVVQCEDIRENLPAGARRRSVVIPNFVPRAANSNGLRQAAREKRGKVVIAMGRLTHQKGFDRLIRAFAQLPAQFSDWSLEIWGQGPLRHELEELAEAEGVGGRVRFPGVSECPAREFSNADLFVLSSRYEGFPNVLLEAMAAGLPPISFACPSGPGEIIRNGVDGLLLEPGDVHGLSEAMRRLMECEAERQRLGARAPEVLTRFSQESVMAQWENLFRQVTKWKEPKSGGTAARASAA